MADRHTIYGAVKVTDEAGKLIFEHAVEEGDIWRMCQTKDEPIQVWQIFIDT